MSKIDMNKINKFIEANKKKKPEWIESVPQEEWENALDGYFEMFCEAIAKETTQEEFWNMIYFSALAFCKGMKYTQIKDKKIKPDVWPRY